MPDDPQPPRTGAFRRPQESKASLLAALAKVLGANLLDVVSPDLADGMAGRVMQDYAEQGGDPGAHATLFGLAGATGATIPPALMALRGPMAPRQAPRAGVSATDNLRFLRSLDTSPVGRGVPGANPLEYIRPRLNGGSGGAKAASLLALLTRQPTDR